MKIPRMSRRPKSMRCVTRVIIHKPKKRCGWQVRVVRRGIAINRFFPDAKFGGNAGALSHAKLFRDETVKDLQPLSRSEIARRLIPRNTSGIPGVRRAVKHTTLNGRTFAQDVWAASGTPQPGKRKTKSFSIKKLGDDEARERAIAQRLRWEKQMERNERKRPRR